MPTTPVIAPGFASAERHATFRFLRERSPVHYDADLGGWCITRYDDVRKVLDLDPGHRDPLPKRVVCRAAEAARDTIARRADELADVDDRTFAQALAATAVAAFLGVPDDEADEFAQLVRDTAENAANVEAAVKLLDYLEDLIRLRAATPRTDLLSDCTEAHAVPAVALAALDTTTTFLTNALNAFGEHPDQIEVLRDDPALAPEAVEELLRFDAPVPVAAPRRTNHPIVLSGRTVEPGQVLLPVVGAANRCPVRFPGADRLDLTRRPQGVLVADETGTAIARVAGEIALVKRLQAPAR